MMLLAFALALVIPESEQVTVEDGKEVFPKAFRGHWAPSRAACDEHNLETFTITEDRIYGYESDSLLIKSTGMIVSSNPHKFPSNGEWAYTVVALTAGVFEADIDFGKVRISRLGEHLYMSNASAVSRDSHFDKEFRNVRCPDPVTQ